MRTRLKRDVDVSYDQAVDRHRHRLGRRHPAPRRGARALAGVRRHRRAAARPGVQGQLAARPDHQRRQGQAPAGREGDGRRRVRPADPAPRARRGGGRARRRLLALGRRRAPRCSRPRGVDLSRASRDFRERAERMVRDWQSGVLDLVRSEGGDKRTTARFLAYGVNGLSVALMVVVFASTGGVTGAEVGIAGGSAVVGQKLLEAVFGDQAVRRLALNARKDLTTRVDALMQQERQRFVGPARRPRAAGGLPGAAARAGPPGRRPALRAEDRRRERAGRRRQEAPRAGCLPRRPARRTRAGGRRGARTAGRRGRRAGGPGRRPGRRPAAALGRAHRGRARRRHRLRQVLDVQRAGRARSRRGRRTPPDDVVRHRLRLGRGPGRRPARVAGDPAAPPRRPRLDARPRPPGQGRSTGWCCSTCPTTTPPR